MQGHHSFPGLCIQADENKKIRCRKTSDLFLKLLIIQRKRYLSYFRKGQYFQKEYYFQKKYCPEKKMSQDFFQQLLNYHQGKLFADMDGTVPNNAHLYFFLPPVSFFVE